ncbi:MAG: response regulator transcription factor [Bacilli bacterium]|nr:response regulator transcription factor [Bacilli bacterium]
MFKVLIIEDEKNIRTIISKYLKRFDIVCIEAENGVQGLATYIREKDNVDLVLMDVMMPEMDGIECTKKIREISDVPIIVLTAKSEDEDEIEALELGVNDFITKPFNLEVLLLRIKNITNFEKSNPLELVPEQRAVKKNGRLISLTKKEYLILEYFFENPNVILTRDQILNRVWGIDYFGDDRVVDTNVKRIRKKIDEEKKYIKTYSGTGYVFVK